jgi:tRNA (cmo5U34)-methyltransferase
LDEEMSWEFNEEVAKDFVDHARKHIPNYDQVIKKSVQLCSERCLDHSSIIDVGCATGETLNKLGFYGFFNLVGVDNSQAMLDQCKAPAQLICSDTLPPGAYDAVLCNWTLHFMKDKEQYLKDIYANLNEGGFLVLSEKTSTDSIPTGFYYDFKIKQGTTVEEIRQKRESLEGVMNINDVEWYLDELKQTGFSKIFIIDADWCFTTFLCVK